MERDKEDIIALEMLDIGKTYRQASDLGFPASHGTLKYYAGWADKVQATYGLAAAVHTKNYERAVQVTNQLQACTAWVNMFISVHWSIPFGAFKQSGLGRECGEAGLEKNTEPNTVVLSMGMEAPS